VIFRRQSVDLRGIEDRIIELVGRDGWNGADKILRRDGRILELGHLEKPGAELSWQGRPHDFIGFDEGARFVMETGAVAFGLRDVAAPRVQAGHDPFERGGIGQALVTLEVG